MFNLPTDNLYKFLAIFGLIIFLFSIYYPFQKYHELNLLVFEHKGEAQLMDDFYKPNIEGKRAYIKEWLKEEKDLEKRKLIFDDLYKSEAEGIKLWVNSVTNARKIEFLDGVWRFYVIAGGLGAFIGLCLMFFWFLYWYRNIQKPLDYQSAQTFMKEKEKDLIIPP